MSKLIVDPILLNKRDFIVIKLLFSHYSNQIIADARILGVKEIEKADRPADKPLLVRLFLEVCIVFILIAIIYIMVKPLDPSISNNIFTILMALFWFLLGALIILLLQYLLKGKQ